MAAPTYDNSASTDSASTVSSLTTASWVIGGSDRFLVAGIGSDSGTPVNPTAMKWGGSGGTDLTKQGSTLNIGSFAKLSCYTLVAPSASTTTLYGSWSANQDEAWIAGVSLNGVNQTTPLGTIATNTTSTSNPTVTVTTVADDLVVDFVHVSDDTLSGATTLTVGAGQTQRQNTGPIGSASVGATSTELATGTSTTMSWTVGGGSTNYTTGIIAVPVKPVSGGAFSLTADAGSYAITGTAAGLLLARKIVGDTGGYSLTGTAASLLFGREVAADSGSYLITGTDATLLYSGSGNKTLAADPGSYSITGTNAALILNRLLTAEAGVYAVSGQTVNLLRSYLLTADGGSYAVNGTAATFLRTYLLNAEAGVYTIQGQTAELVYSAAPMPSGDFLIFLRRRRRHDF